MSKLAIIGGAGGLGSTMGFYLGLGDYFDHISLIDRKRNVLETHLIDLAECFSEETPTTISGGGYEELEGADLIIFAAAASGRQVSSRNEYLKTNLSLVQGAAKQIRELAPEATLVSCTAPVDVFVQVFLRELGWDRRRVLGFCRNDSQRFRYMAAEVLKLEDPSQVGGMVVGEHGETQVPLFSTLSYKGAPVETTPSERKAIEEMVKNWYVHWQSQDAGRTTTWTSTTGVWHTVVDLNLAPRTVEGEERRDANRVFHREPTQGMGSVLLDGEYGLRDVALGMPLVRGTHVWGGVVELELWPEETGRLKLSAERVRGLYAETLA
ncbi:MAG: hypothetical protein LBP95_07565 [Deltaproteobacteria bacterium]|jgi:malate/lactate dehydrogenase|nr:hypothetical protein [Deltaproteobacteria bacterium]